MTNIEFLNYVNSKIVKHKDTNIYYAYVGAIYGYDESYGYDEGLLFEINDDMILDAYSIENILIKNMYDDEHVHTINDEEKEQGVFNIYVPVNHIDFAVYKLRNEMNSYKYSEDELNNFVTTFMKLIQSLANFNNDNMNTDKNQIYKRVIDFYANNQIDSAYINLTLLFNSQSYKHTSTNTVSTCGCTNNSNQNTSSTDTTDCATKYINAIQLYLIQMLSDKEFYCDFFYIENKPIVDLIDNLIRLITEFKTLGYNISFNDSNKTHCGCSELAKDNGTCNYNILDNYIQVLIWVKECKIEENANKIKIYGEQFAELLPKLQF